MKKIMAVIIIVAVVFSFIGSAPPQNNLYELNISSDNISYRVSDTLYGVSLDNTNFAIDGGLVSNLVNNNSFEYPNNPLTAWKVTADRYSIISYDSMNDNNKNYLSLTVNEKATVVNNGFTEIYNYKSFDFNRKKAETPDMGFKAGEEYLFSAYFKNKDFEGNITVSIVAGGEEQKYQFNIDDCNDWKKVSLSLKSNVTADGYLSFLFEGKGTLLMDFVSLVPAGSYGVNSENWKYISLRQDMVDALSALSPKFIKFGGECVCEGENIGNLFNWKNTIGPIEERTQGRNPNSDDKNGRAYVNTNSMGYHEYLTLCSELNAIPVPSFNAGMVCQESCKYSEYEEKYKKGAISESDWQAYLETVALVPETEDFESYVQDILDLIEYALGDSSTVWGSKRAENGHPEPFDLKYIALGYENFGEIYWRNFDALYTAIKNNYPQITVIASTGSHYEGEDFDSAWKNINNSYRDVLADEHIHTEGGYQFSNTHRYDEYERSGAKVAVGEYSARSQGHGTVMTKSNIWGAVEDAAFLTSLERNGDVVKMVSYAPIFAKINAQCNDINMIWFDSQSLVLSPDYYMHMIFANNYGTNYISSDFDREDEGLYTSVTVDTQEKVIYAKIVNSSNTDRKININLDGFENVNNVSVQLMDEVFKEACNEINEEHLHVAPVKQNLETVDDTISYNSGGLSVAVVRIPYSTNDGNSLYELPEIELISPYIPPAIKITITAILGVLVGFTAVIILCVRIKNHKKDREKTKQA